MKPLNLQFLIVRAHIISTYIIFSQNIIQDQYFWVCHSTIDCLLTVNILGLRLDLVLNFNVIIYYIRHSKHKNEIESLTLKETSLLNSKVETKSKNVSISYYTQIVTSNLILDGTVGLYRYSFCYPCISQFIC